jgi:endo-1,4-beta-xylanase
VAPNHTGLTRTTFITIEGSNGRKESVFVSQTSAPPPVCDTSNRLVNPGFENGTSGWTVFGGSLSTIGSPARTGASSGRVTSRTATWQGPVQDLLGKVTAGHTYTAQSWARVSGTSNQPLALTLKTECAGSAATYSSLGTATGSPSSWAQLSGPFTVPSCSLTSFAVYVEGPASGITLYADDASVVEVCP